MSISAYCPKASNASGPSVTANAARGLYVTFKNDEIRGTAATAHAEQNWSRNEYQYGDCGPGRSEDAHISKSNDDGFDK